MRSHSSELSVALDLFPRASWTSQDPFAFAGAEYPGLRPTGSWRLSPNGELHGLDPAGDGWCDRETGERVSLSGRCIVLAYGSNANPAKLLSKPRFFGGDCVIALRAAVFGWASAWCDARRGFDQSVVATLVRAPRRVEVHPVLALTQPQLKDMDEWEGHPRCYCRDRHEGKVWLESGRWLDHVETYYGTPELRPPLVVAGDHLLVADVGYAAVDSLVAR